MGSDKGDKSIKDLVDYEIFLVIKEEVRNVCFWDDEGSVIFVNCECFGKGGEDR